jgi:NAD(P)H-dependent flavin oxidoreductase YrpB (nitropropane dioxygenase family)
VNLPVIALGGIATAADVTAAIEAGAAAVAVGTVLLRSDEAGTAPVHKAALADPARTTTVRTCAFTGRPARGLRNAFTDSYDHLAPSGYPAVHHLTSPLRKAAAVAGDPERVHLWAGTGFRHATAEPAAAILTRLAGRLLPGVELPGVGLWLRADVAGRGADNLVVPGLLHDVRAPADDPADRERRREQLARQADRLQDE